VTFSVAVDGLASVAGDHCSSTTDAGTEVFDFVLS
jgi:hypothetical protein